MSIALECICQLSVGLMTDAKLSKRDQQSLGQALNEGLLMPASTQSVQLGPLHSCKPSTTLPLFLTCALNGNVVLAGLAETNHVVGRQSVVAFW